MMTATLTCNAEPERAVKIRINESIHNIQNQDLKTSALWRHHESHNQNDMPIGCQPGGEDFFEKTELSRSKAEEDLRCWKKGPESM
jgi:hypothetical protein